VDAATSSDLEKNELLAWYRGAVLAPWPNRLADGRNSFTGQTPQLLLTALRLSYRLPGGTGTPYGCSCANRTSSIRICTEAPWPWNP
jgi:aldose 1-epimerase